MTHNLNVNFDLCQKSNIDEKFGKDSGADMMVYSEDGTARKAEVKEECYDFDIPIDNMEFGYIKAGYISSSSNNLGSMKSTEQSSNQHVEDITVTKTEVKEECYDVDMSIDDMEFGNIEQEYISLSENSFSKANLEPMKSTEQSWNKDVDVGNGELRGTDHQINKYRYELCQSDFNGEIYLRSHREHCPLAQQKLSKQRARLKHNSDKTYRCAHCTFSTCVRSRFVNHVRIHTKDKYKCSYKKCKCTPEQKESSRCNTCGFAATQKVETHRKNSLEQSTHTNKKSYRCTYKDCSCVPGQKESCKCDMCEYEATRKYDLNRHVLVKHSGAPKKYKCRDCKYTTHRKSSLFIHSRIHTNEKPFRCIYKDCRCAPGQQEICECNTCGFTTAAKHSLKIHVLVKHSDEQKKYKCRNCEYATHTKKSLVLHNRSHTKEKPFRCTYKDCRCAPGQEEICECNTCRHATTDKDSLKKHILVKHSDEPKKYKCRECMYATHIKNSLLIHSRIHTNEKPFKCTYKNCKCATGQKEFCKCDMCEYEATRKYDLNRHILVKHSGEPKKYKCKDCEYATHTKRYLVVHSRNHTNEKPFRCTYKDCRCAPGQEEFCKCKTCGFAPSTKYSLKRHIDLKHSGE